MARAVRTLATNAVDLRCVSSLDRPPGRISTTVLNLKRHTRAPASCSIWLVLRVSHRFDGLSTKRRSGCRAPTAQDRRHPFSGFPTGTRSS